MAEMEPNRRDDPMGEEGTSRAEQAPPKRSKRSVFYVTATVIALTLFAAAVMDPLVSVLRYIFSVLSPLIIGGVIAYLCDPILELFEYRVFGRMKKGNLRRGLALLCTVITAFGIVALVFAMMIPQLVRSLTELFNNYESYLNSFLS